MNTRKLQLLLHPLFIIALVFLLLNDFYWKYEYPNWLTGKLSDLTGLFVLSVFLSAFFPIRRSMTCWAIVIFFIWWKTPLSQPVIDSLSNLFSIQMERTVDYSDYLALPVVFVPYFIKTQEYKVSLVNRIAVYFTSVVCLVAFCSTSIYRKFMIAPDFGKRIQYNENYNSNFSDLQVLHKLDSLQLDYKIDSFTTAPLTFYGGSLLIRKKDSSDKSWIVIDPQQKDTTVYFRIDEQPYIAIYNFNAAGEVFPQINITLRYFVRTSTITLKTVFLNDQQMDEYYRKRDKTKKRIRKVIEKELMANLK